MAGWLFISVATNTAAWLRENGLWLALAGKAWHAQLAAMASQLKAGMAQLMPASSGWHHS